MRLPIEEAGGKFRSDGVSGKPEDLALDCWAGIIPLNIATGPLQPAADVGAGQAPISGAFTAMSGLKPPWHSRRAHSPTEPAAPATGLRHLAIRSQLA